MEKIFFNLQKKSMKIGENGETDTKLMNGTTDYCKDVPNYYMIILIKISAGFLLE